MRFLWEIFPVKIEPFQAPSGLGIYGNQFSIQFNTMTSLMREPNIASKKLDSIQKIDVQVAEQAL